MRIAEHDHITGETVYRDATPEEIAAVEQAANEHPQPTPEERIAALEEQLAAAKILLGVE